jgi:hypothetical protein
VPQDEQGRKNHFEGFEIAPFLFQVIFHQRQQTKNNNVIDWVSAESTLTNLR